MSDGFAFQPQGTVAITGRPASQRRVKSFFLLGVWEHLNAPLKAQSPFLIFTLTPWAERGPCGTESGGGGRCRESWGRGKGPNLPRQYRKPPSEARQAFDTAADVLAHILCLAVA